MPRPRGFFVVTALHTATRAAQPPDAIPRPQPDPWRIGWNILASNTLLGCTVAGIALALLITAWLPQAPDSVSNPIAFSRWLSEAHAQWGSLYPAMKALGMFSLARSTALSGLVGLSALCLLVRAADSIYLAGSLHAHRTPWSLAGQLVIYLGALTIIASLVLTSVRGWRADGLTLCAQQMAPVNRLGQPLYNLRLDELDPSGLGWVTLLKETETVGAGALAYGAPVELAGLVFSMRGSGPAIRARATLTDGQAVLLRSTANSDPVNELVLPLTRDEPDRFFAAPEAGLVIRLARGSDNTQPIRAQVYRSQLGTLLFDDGLPADGLVTVEQTRLNLQTERYVVVDAIYSPGRPVALAGMALLALGLVVAAVQKLQYIPSPSRLERLRQTIPSVGWVIGLAVLALAAASASAFNLRQGELVPTAHPALSCVALWLAGCALAVWDRRPTRWAIVALALVALVILTLQAQPGPTPLV